MPSFPLLELCLYSYCRKLCFCSRCWSCAFIPSQTHHHIGNELHAFTAELHFNVCVFIENSSQTHQLVGNALHAFTVDSHLYVCVFSLQTHRRHTSSSIAHYTLHALTANISLLKTHLKHNSSLETSCVL